MRNLKELNNALKIDNPTAHIAMKACFSIAVILFVMLIGSLYAEAQTRNYCEKPDGTIIITKWAVCPAGTTPV
jgi:hypothetical protein